MWPAIIRNGKRDLNLNLKDTLLSNNSNMAKRICLFFCSPWTSSALEKQAEQLGLEAWDWSSWDLQSSNFAEQSGGDWIAGDCWMPLPGRGWQHQQVPQPDQDVEDEEDGEQWWALTKENSSHRIWTRFRYVDRSLWWLKQCKSTKNHHRTTSDPDQTPTNSPIRIKTMMMMMMMMLARCKLFLSKSEGVSKSVAMLHLNLIIIIFYDYWIFMRALVAFTEFKEKSYILIISFKLFIVTLISIMVTLITWSWLYI